MAMEINYPSASVRKNFETQSKLLRKHGARRAAMIQQRLYELSAAECLEDLRHLPGPRLHQLVREPGQAKAIFSVDLDHPYRLLFTADHDPEPSLAGGGVDWTRVTKILIVGIEDTHE